MENDEISRKELVKSILKSIRKPISPMDMIKNRREVKRAVMQRFGKVPTYKDLFKHIKGKAWVP
jgi:hypothetical protein